MVNHETNELFFDNLEIPAENLIGEEGKGFKYILDGLNAERTLIAAECIGDGYWFIDKVTRLVRQRARGVRPAHRPEPGRAVPDRRGLHRGRGGQPDALEGLRLFDAHQPCGAEANMAKYLAAKASGRRPTPACRPRRLRLRLRIRRRAQVPRDAAVPGGADLDQPDPVSYVAEHVLGCRGRSEGR
jgi:acyl-CoA dehydrogenase